jgi:hypothetical protein
MAAVWIWVCGELISTSLNALCIQAIFWRIEIGLKTDKGGSEISMFVHPFPSQAFLTNLTCPTWTNRSSRTDDQHLNKAQTPQVVVEDQDQDLRERLAVAEKNCNHFFELYKKYRLRWLEEIHCASILEKYAPSDVDCYTAAQMQWDAPSPFCPTEIQGEIAKLVCRSQIKLKLARWWRCSTWGKFWNPVVVRKGDRGRKT